VSIQVRSLLNSSKSQKHVYYFVRYKFIRFLAVLAKIFFIIFYLLFCFQPKTPELHSYKVGEMLEVVNPYSMMVFYVGTIVKIYDNRYFKVEVDNEIDEDKRISFVATKENPYLFHAGLKNGFLYNKLSIYLLLYFFRLGKQTQVFVKNSD